MERYTLGYGDIVLRGCAAELCNTEIARLIELRNEAGTL